MNHPISSPQDLRRVTGADFTVSAQQWAAISADLEPAVVIAGAGSGKTELMSARVIYLVANGLVRPDEVLGLTFTTKATAELGERIRGALAKAGLDVGTGEDNDAPERLEPMVSTYNAYGALLLSEHGLRIGHEPDLRVMADAARFQLAAEVVARHPGEVARLSDHPPTVIGYLLALEGAMNEHLVSVDEVRGFQRDERPQFVSTVQRLLDEPRSKTRRDQVQKVIDKMAEREELLDLVTGYRDLKARHGLIDFSDQIARAHELVLAHPPVGQQERSKYKVVLLDEYQDTSVAQARLLAGLFSGPTPEQGRGHAVMAVGDPNQAIYGWRGASASNIKAFRQQFPTSNGEEAHHYPLTVNRRSDRRILQLANSLATPLYDDATMLVQPLEAKDQAVDGVVRAVVHRTDSDELDWLVVEVKHAHERLSSLGGGTTESPSPTWSEIGVLVRTNKHAAAVHDALSAAEVPVEIVGLGGLIRLPEVAQVVATLSLVEDLTDNAALLTLLTGPRWEIGPRDLALLGARSREIAKFQHARDLQKTVVEELHESVSGADPTEVAALGDALDDPGELAYSPEALGRFKRLSAELRMLRAHVGEPLLDLLRRIIDVCGLDVELASSASPAAESRRDNLEVFVKAVADFQAVDGKVTLAALNAWLETEDDYGGGLDLASPSAADSVKLLTVHRAKGLEYDVVFLVGVGEKKFPVDTLRPQWTTRADVLPSSLRGDRDDVPQLSGHDPEGLSDFLDQARRHQRAEELRLGYVAFTRARHEFVVSSHTWSGQLKKPIKPSPFQELTRELMASWGLEPEGWHCAEPDEENPNTLDPPRFDWPVRLRTHERELRERAATRVRSAMAATPAVLGLSAAEAAAVRQWDEEIERLLVEAAEQFSDVIEVPMPASLSATSLKRLAEDRDGFAREVARPFPRKPVPQARFGTRFHAWVESRWGQQQLIDPDELPGRFDTDIEDDTELKDLQARFERGLFGERTPIAVEPPFALVVADQLVRGRIDAVFEDPDAGPGHFLVVDWKTNRIQSADPLQLAIYRQAWAELQGVPHTHVRAAFYYVRTDSLVEPHSLASREELEALVRSAGVGLQA